MTDKEKQDKFLELFEPLYDRLNAFVFSLARDRELTKEIISETVLQAYERFETLRNQRAFLSYLFTIASRAYYAYIKDRNIILLRDMNDFAEVMKDNFTPDIAYDIKVLYEKLESLPLQQKEAIVLFEILGFSLKEAAVIQNTTVVNIKLRLHRARKKLKLLLSDSITLNTNGKNINHPHKENLKLQEENRHGK